MTRYFFGHLFVRFAKVIAVLVLVGGCCGAGIGYMQATMEATSIRYEPGRMLGTKLFALSEEWDRAQRFVVVFPGRETVVGAKFEIPKTPDTSGELGVVAQQLARIQQERDQLKYVLVNQFDSSTEEIERKLRAHAATLKGQTARNPRPAAAKAEVSDATKATGPESLFVPLDRTEIASRHDVFDRGVDFLSVLKSSTENPENAKILSQAVDELKLLETLLPAGLDVSVTPTAGKENSEATPASGVQVNADRVADLLRRVRASVHAALLTEWAVDRALDEAISEVDHERLRCVGAERNLKRLWLTVGSAMGLVLVASIFTSFIILVMADLTQAFLDAAINSAIVATAYTNAQVDEVEEV